MSRFLIFLYTLFSQETVEINTREDIPTNGHWKFDCSLGYVITPSDFYCGFEGVDFPSEDLNGEIGFWTKCGTTCDVIYKVQPSDTRISFRFYQSALTAEISLDDATHIIVTGENWVEYSHVLTNSGIQEVRLRLDYFASQYYTLLDKIVLSRELITTTTLISIPSENPTSAQYTTLEPTNDPTSSDTTDPTSSDTTDTTSSDTTDPTSSDTTDPTTDPTSSDTTDPTTDPTSSDTTDPTTDPTSSDTTDPTTDPTTSDTTDPTTDPTSSDTTDPTTDPTSSDTPDPTTDPTSSDTTDPTSSDTTDPTSSDATDPTSSDTTDTTTLTSNYSTTTKVSSSITTFKTTTIHPTSNSPSTYSSPTFQTSSAISSSENPWGTSQISTFDPSFTPTYSSTSDFTENSQPDFPTSAKGSTEKSGFIASIWSVFLFSILGIIIFVLTLIFCIRQLIGKRYKRDNEDDLVNILPSSSPFVQRANKIHEPYTFLYAQSNKILPSNPQHSSYSVSPRAKFRESTPYLIFEQEPNGNQRAVHMENSDNSGMSIDNVRDMKSTKFVRVLPREPPTTIQNDPYFDRSQKDHPGPSRPPWTLT
ncbi:unnamed protein product [Orchesella dallaii]|uniref:Uncharacterized protein n=1 Tax=Orchesella dallaii TaxID=48710 RepID=A0ABP1QSV9_9HEXA